MRINAFRTFPASTRPRNLAFASPAMKKKFQPAAWSLRSRSTPFGDVNLSYLLIQHRHIHVFPGIQNISARFYPLNTIGAAHARFRRKRGYFPGKELSFGFLDFITNPNPAKLQGSGLQHC
jgi:hypothetical protein